MLDDTDGLVDAATDHTASPKDNIDIKEDVSTTSLTTEGKYDSLG